MLHQPPPCFLVLAELSFYNLLIVSKQVTRSIIVKLEKADAYNVAQKKARDFRLSAAVELVAEQKRGRDEGLITWREWCKQKLSELSSKEIRSLLRFSKSYPPKPKKTPPTPPPPDTPPMIQGTETLSH